jgi:hypothetical protein
MRTWHQTLAGAREAGERSGRIVMAFFRAPG